MRNNRKTDSAWPTPTRSALICVLKVLTRNLSSAIYSLRLYPWTVAIVVIYSFQFWVIPYQSWISDRNYDKNESIPQHPMDRTNLKFLEKNHQMLQMLTFVRPILYRATGDSGKKKKPHRKTRANAMVKIDEKSYGQYSPKTNTIRVPKVHDNTNNEPSVPRIRSSAISEMNTGTIAKIAPPHKPCKKRAKHKWYAFFA